MTFRWMRRRISLSCALAVAAAVVIGCDDVSCPMGFADVSGRCVPYPAAATDDGGAPVIGTALDGGPTNVGTNGGPMSGNESSGTGGEATAHVAAGNGAGGPPSAGMHSGVSGSPGGAGSGGMSTPSDSPAVDPSGACAGSAGQPVCDSIGTLYLCNSDGTIRAQEACESPQLCRAGLGSMSCAVCVASGQYRCVGRSLEVCAPDGTGYVPLMNCDNEALCNPLAGMCTTAVCAPGKTACQGNTLTVCNSDGTDFSMKLECGGDTCDALGGDCNKCEPGQKTCEGNDVLTCNPTGQGYDATACSSNLKCIGMGQCVACVEDTDCGSLTRGCSVGVCGSNNRCVTANAPARTQCTAPNGRPGTCSGATCECTPQCNKPCGADGCGGQCENQCGPNQECSQDRCVDCTSDSDCRDMNSADGCKQGYCTGQGRCATRNASTSTACTTPQGQSGRCSSSGSCQCTPNCAEGRCGDNGCGGQCPTCPSGQMCESDRCVSVPADRPYDRCSGNLTACSPAESGTCNAYNYCSPTCSATRPCPNLPGATVMCSLGRCNVQCNASVSCPAGWTCNSSAQLCGR